VISPPEYFGGYTEHDRHGCADGIRLRGWHTVARSPSIDRQGFAQVPIHCFGWASITTISLPIRRFRLRSAPRQISTMATNDGSVLPGVEVQLWDQFMHAESKFTNEQGQACFGSWRSHLTSSRSHLTSWRSHLTS